MNVLHCVETQGINGAKDTMNCALTHHGQAILTTFTWIAAVAFFIVVVLLIINMYITKEGK